MKLDIDLRCDKCGQPITQTLNGSYHCGCGIHPIYNYMAVGSDNQ